MERSDSSPHYGCGKKLSCLRLARVGATGRNWKKAFYRLLILKAPQKVLLYSCAKWKEEVLEQLTGAVMRYPQHIQGEQYLAVNLAAMEGKVFGRSAKYLMMVRLLCRNRASCRCRDRHTIERRVLNQEKFSSSSPQSYGNSRYPLCCPEFTAQSTE